MNTDGKSEVTVTRTEIRGPLYMASEWGPQCHHTTSPLLARYRSACMHTQMCVLMYVCVSVCVSVCYKFNCTL